MQKLLILPLHLFLRLEQPENVFISKPLSAWLPLKDHTYLNMFKYDYMFLSCHVRVSECFGLTFYWTPDTKGLNLNIFWRTTKQKLYPDLAILRILKIILQRKR